MTIQPIFSLSPDSNALAQQLWEKNMHEPWSDYNGADMFVVRTDDTGDIVGGFAVYHDESDGVVGNFCSGWAQHGAKVPTDRIIKQIAINTGDLYFKTDQRTAKILLEKIGKRVKNTERFGYYIIRGNKNGKTTQC